MKLHLTDDGPKICRAATIYTCQKRAESGKPAEHFNSKEEAWEAYDKRLSKEYRKVASPLRKIRAKDSTPVYQELRMLKNTYADFIDSVIPRNPEYQSDNDISHSEIKNILSVMNTEQDDEKSWNPVSLDGDGKVKVPKISQKEFEVYSLLNEYNKYMDYALDFRGNVKYHLNQNSDDEKTYHKEIYEQGYVVGCEAAMILIEDKLRDNRYKNIDVKDVKKRIKMYQKAVITGRAKNMNEHIEKYDSAMYHSKMNFEKELQRTILHEMTPDKSNSQDGLRDFASYDLNSPGILVSTLSDGTIVKGEGILARAALAFRKNEQQL